MSTQRDDCRYLADALDSLGDLRDAIAAHARRIAAAAELGIEELACLTKVYSALAKVEVDKRKINTSLKLARLKRDEAQARLDAIKAKNNPGAAYGADAEAPWGRKFDGTPTTREEFLTRLDQSCADIYGLDLKYGPEPVIKRFPGDHLPEHMRTPENIALGQQGILPPGHPCGPALEEDGEGMDEV